VTNSANEVGMENWISLRGKLLNSAQLEQTLCEKEIPIGNFLIFSWNVIIIENRYKINRSIDQSLFKILKIHPLSFYSCQE
jgi:hypothetical protein